MNSLTKKSREQRKRLVALLGPERGSVCLVLEPSFELMCLHLLLYLKNPEGERWLESVSKPASSARVRSVGLKAVNDMLPRNRTEQNRTEQNRTGIPLKYSIWTEARNF